MRKTVLLSFLAGIACGACGMLLWSWKDDDASRQDTLPREADVASVEADAKMGDAREETPAVEPEEMPVLVVTAETIPPEAPVAAESIAVRSLRAGDVPPDAFQTIEELNGLVFRSTAYRGDVITRPKLMSESEVVSQLPVEQDAPRLETPVVVVTTGTIPPGQPLTDEMVAVRPMRISDVPPGAIEDIEELKDLVLKGVAYQGDVITAPKLTPQSARSSAKQIPSGFRVYTVQVAGSSPPLSVFRPRAFVDVYVTYQQRDSDGGVKSTTKMILDMIEVYAIGQPTPQNKLRNISLLVKPKQAAILMMADRKGDIAVVLRSKTN